MTKIEMFDIQLFAEGDFTPGTTPGTATITNVNTTTQTATGKDMSPTIKTAWSRALLENARADIIFGQFGKKQSMHGNKIEWRKFNTFPKALTPLTEGVIPPGQTFGMTKIEATTTQHGDYVPVTDRLELEAFDDVIYGATEEMGAAMAATYDTLTRNVLIGGNSVMYCPAGATAVTSRANLTNAAVLTPAMVAKAATWLKKNKAPKIEGTYVALIHPSVALDLRESEEWKEFHKYDASAAIFNGEIGTLHGVRFIESTDCKVWGAGSASAPASVAAYATIFLGKDAFGILDIDGEGQEMIIKPKEQIGGPLNQFSTIGYKFCHGAKILYQERLLRVESGSSSGSVDEGN